MEEHHTDEPFKLLTPETTRLSAFWLIPGIVHPPPPSLTLLQPVLSHPLLLRYYTRLTFATLTLQLHQPFSKRKPLFFFTFFFFESILINFPALEISIPRLFLFSLSFFRIDFSAFRPFHSDSNIFETIFLIFRNTMNVVVAEKKKN